MSAIPGDFEVGGTGLGESNTALYTGTGSTDVITLLNGEQVTNGQTVTFDAGGIPSGLTPGTTYYVVDQSGNTFRISATPGGAPIDIGDGSGLLVLGDMRVATLLEDVFIGGSVGYMEKISKDAKHLTWLECRDVPVTGNPMTALGTTVGPDGEPYSALKPTGAAKDYQPHDVSYDFANDRLVVILSKLDNTALIRIYSTDMLTLIAEFTGIDTDAGWTQDIPLKIVVDCSGEVAYYTCQGPTLFRYDLTGAGAQLTPYAEQDPGSPYMFADLDLFFSEEINVNETGSGHGPREALTLGSEDFSWSDRINPPNGIHKIWKMRTSDHIDVIDYAVALNPDGNNLGITTAGAYYLRCAETEQDQGYYVVVTVIGAN